MLCLRACGFESRIRHRPRFRLRDEAGERMSEPPSSRTRRWLIVIGAAVVFGAVIFAVRLLIGQGLDEAVLSGAIAAVGIVLAIALIGRLSRNPRSRYAVMPAVERAMRTGIVPDDADAPRWLEVLRSSRRVERVSGWLLPVLLVAAALGAFTLRDDERGILYVVVGVLLLVGAIAAPLYVRRELRQMARVEHVLVSRLDPPAPHHGPDDGTPPR